MDNNGSTDLQKGLGDSALLSGLDISLILGSIDDYVLYHGPDMKILWVNRAVELSESRTAGPVIGEYCWKVWHQKNTPCHGCPAIEALQTGEMRKALVMTSDGKEWLIQGYPVKGPNGAVSGVVTINRDLTEYIRSDEELLKAKLQAELYLDLMGHDINNMHQIALGYMELARCRYTGPDPGRNEFLDKSIEVLQRSSQLIQNVRKLQKLHKGELRTAAVDVPAVLAGVQGEFEAATGRRITLNLNGHQHCYARANELLHDVFANLVGNAVKYAGERAEIIVDMDVIEENGKRCCRVIVEDNGPGIPDEAKDAVFYRIGKSTSHGMGLGLYIVKSLVEGYGGKVSVGDRVIGDHTRGARFVVMLPAAVNES
ncbi:PAS domain-containing sensor histidine kinase [Methanocella arvoryzae]|uniref:histidine kinase n=1 Tax=Methanocella arvoryzae (strain DSM 22066 / NBRC 105507 / MRE50) TaxID=351160 RepID=Q0W4W9_METAR|nr:PAS domain-containing sensor histidine kinase [Methanocella arvoryzae]CAJ36574.1 predicted signal transduction histidine kinase [Methanocella arvoryzae MRE50]